MSPSRMTAFYLPSSPVLSSLLLSSIPLLCSPPISCPSPLLFSPPLLSSISFPPSSPVLSCPLLCSSPLLNLLLSISHLLVSLSSLFLITLEYRVSILKLAH